MVARTLEELLTELRGKVTRLERRLARQGAGGGGGGGGTTFTVGPGLDMSGTNVLSVEPQLTPDLPDLGVGKDLNTVQTTGWYIQMKNASATLALNYPVARAGHLEVSAGLQGTGADFFMQTFTEYAPVAPATYARQWRRTHYSGTWTPWTEVPGALAAALPPPIRYAPGNVNNVTATSWAIVPGTAAQSMTTAKPLWVLVTFGAWIQASAGETRAGIELGGATVVTPASDPQGTKFGSGAWGQTIQMGSTDSSNTGMRSQQRLYLLNAGTTTFTIEGYLATAGTHQVNYPVLEIIPLYYDGDTAALPAPNAIVGAVAGMKICTGIAETTVAVAPDATSTTIAVTFPVGLFSAPPIPGGNGANGRMTIYFTNVTKDGMTIGVNNWSNGNLGAGADVYWHAIGI